MNIEVDLVAKDEKNGCSTNVEHKDVVKNEKVQNDECKKNQNDCEMSEKVEEEGNKMSENTAGINKRRHSESEDGNISTVKKTKLNEKMETTPDTSLLENDKLESTSMVVDDGKLENMDKKKDPSIDSTRVLNNDENPIASSSDDQDDLLDRLDAIDSSGLRPPDLKLDEIDTTDLDKDDLLKRLEEAECDENVKKETVKIHTAADDNPIVSDDLLLEADILTENNELELPSSTNTDSASAVKKVCEDKADVLTSNDIDTNMNVTNLKAADAVVSDSTGAKDEQLDQLNDATEATNSELFAVDSTDEQKSSKSSEILNDQLANTVDSTNDATKTINDNVEAPSTSTATTSNSENNSESVVSIKIDSINEKVCDAPKKEKEVESCADSTNQCPIDRSTADTENEIVVIDSTQELKSNENETETNESADLHTVDSTNEKCLPSECREVESAADSNMKPPDSDIKPPDSSSTSETNAEVLDKINLVEENNADSFKVPTEEIPMCDVKPETPKEDMTDSAVYLTISDVQTDKNIPLTLQKGDDVTKDNIELMDVDPEESSEAQPAVDEDLLKSSNTSEIENNESKATESAKKVSEINESVITESDKMNSSDSSITKTSKSNESSEAQPLLPESTTGSKIGIIKEIPNSSVTSSSTKEETSVKPKLEKDLLLGDASTSAKEEQTVHLAKSLPDKPLDSDVKTEQIDAMEVEESLLADNEATDLHEQQTAIVIDCDNDQEITSNVSENEAPLKSDPVKIDDPARYSDSTASINSTSEEALINHNKETHIEENEKCEDNLNMSVDAVDNNHPKTLNKEKLFGNVMLMNNGSSTPNSNNTSVTTSNVFNSTPIQKPFEISSENVSKISEKPCTSTSIVILDDDDDDTVADTTEDEGKTLTESETQCSSDGITNFAKSIIKLNGLSPSSQSEGIKSIDDDNLVKDSLNGLTLDLTNEISEESLYEVGIWYEDNEMKFLAVEKLDRNKKISGRLTPVSSSDLTGNESSDKRSSNGSVGSLGPFTLPQARLSAVSSNSSSSMSHKSGVKFAIPALPQRNKQTIKGITTLCNFMIDHFTKIKANLNQSRDNPDSLTNTPKVPGKEATKKSLIKECNEFTGDDDKFHGKGNKRKADTSNDSISGTDDEKTPKKVSKKVAKTSNVSATKQGQFLVPPSEVLDDAKIGLNVLARWIDKKYYAGKVMESKPGMKYVIKFEDGALKTLPQDFIVFGRDENILPLLGHKVHALVENDEYEVGYVQESEIEDGTIYYKVSIHESKTIRVTSSDIYLTDDQAKAVQDVFKNISDLNVSDGKLNPLDTSNSKPGSATKGRPHRNIVQKPEVIAATTPSGRGRKKGDKAGNNETEAGFSGGIAPSKRGRKPKRPQPQSESSDVSDSLELDSAPNSPDSALEAINGVQPELQKTPKESQINKMCIMAEYLGTDKPDKNKNLEDLLGPIPNNKSLFRNKHFILTCTIAMKSPRPSATKKTEYPDDMKNKYRKFTALPFIKEHLRKQIEDGGGKVYNHFEDIPKNKYKQCKLIAPSPCVTAKYVQCLAAEIPALSHEWIIESCRNNSLADTKLYALPSGWSLIEERYIKWAVGRNTDQRSTSNPLANHIILMASQDKDFTDFWTRVCKLAGSTIRVVKTAADITQGQNGCMLTDEEFPQDIKSKAEHFGIPIVSTVWVVQCLILGKVCKPDAHEKLTQIYQDDDY